MPKNQKRGLCLPACCWHRLIRPSNSPMNSLKPLPGAPAVGVYRQTCSGIPLDRFVGRDRLFWNSMVQGTQRFRQVRAASCVIPYVLCGCLYSLDVHMFRGVPCPPLYIRGDRVTWKVLAEYSWSPTTTWSDSFLVLQLILCLFGQLQER